MEVNTVINALVIAGVLAMIACPSLAFVTWAMWRSNTKLHTELNSTKRRLADVEVVRAGAPVARTHPRAILALANAAKRFREYEASHSHKAGEIITLGKSDERDQRLEKAARNKDMAEAMEFALTQVASPQEIAEAYRATDQD